jgi:hypothetical protein
MDSNLKKYQTGFTRSSGYEGLRPKGISPQAKKIFTPLAQLNAKPVYPGLNFE